jgi:hypothetical protein
MNEKKNFAKYSFRYRILKTILFHFSCLSLGVTSEIFGTTNEDLKILLNVNYQKVSTLVIARIVGYMTSLLITGVIIDPFLKYSDLLISIALFGMSFRKLN